MELYTITCVNATCTVAQDILAAFCAGTRKLHLLAFEMAANGQTTQGNYPFHISRLNSGYSPGSGGYVVTPVNVNLDGAAAVFSASRNSTTVASGGSPTPEVIMAGQFNPLNGYYWQSPTGIGDEPKAEQAGGFVLTLDALTTALNISATMWLREV